MAEYTEAFAGFILEAKDAYNDLCVKILAGEVPAGAAATVTIRVPSQGVNMIRSDMLGEASVNGHG